MHGMQGCKDKIRTGCRVARTNCAWGAGTMRVGCKVLYGDVEMMHAWDVGLQGQIVPGGAAASRMYPPSPKKWGDLGFSGGFGAALVSPEPSGAGTLLGVSHEGAAGPPPPAPSPGAVVVPNLLVSGQKRRGKKKNHHPTLGFFFFPFP